MARTVSRAGSRPFNSLAFNSLAFNSLVNDVACSLETRISPSNITSSLPRAAP
jgi:hypothetical protein